MKEKTVPLLKISSSSSIYFDFKKQTLFIQNFGGSHTEESGKSYSYFNTIWLSFGILVSAVVFGWVWDFYIKVPVIVSLIVFTVLGILTGKIFIKIMVKNSMRSRSYEDIDKNSIQKILKQRQGFVVLSLTLWIFAIAVTIGSLIALTMGKIDGESSFMLSLGWFVVSLLKSFHPQLGIKAIKIIKKQSKEGNFND